MHKQKQGFTLVELIVVITILAILGTIAIMAFSGYSKNARDSARIADIGNMKKALELWILQSGIYPEPTNGTGITFSGTYTLWNQGTFGDTVFNTVGKLEKKPIDPLYDTEYTYSLTNSKKEYELGAVLEGIVAYENPLLSQTYAATETKQAYVLGNYNGVLTTINSNPSYVIAIPSIILSDLSNTNLDGTTNVSLVYHKKNNLPSSYEGKNLTMTSTDLNFTPQVVWTGTGITALNNQSQFQLLVSNMQNVYSSGSFFASLPEYKNIASTDLLSNEAIGTIKTVIETNTNQELSKVKTTPVYNDCTAITYNGYNVPNILNTTSQNVTKNVSNGVSNITATCTSGVLSYSSENITCDTNYTWNGIICLQNPPSCSTTIPSNATTSEGSPSITSQAWQTQDSAQACHFVCNAGYGFDGTSCVSATNCITGLEYITLSNGQSWSCKNLGATTVRDGSTQPTNCGGSAVDCNSGLTWLGNYYQWGRNDTGWTSPITNGDWQSPQVNEAWGGSSSDTPTSNGVGTTSIGRKGLCPVGYHIPSVKDWQDMCNNVLGGTCTNGMAYNSLIVTKLKLPFVGFRMWNTSNYQGQSLNAQYWTSSPGSTGGYFLAFDNGFIYPARSENRSYGFSLRCLKNP